MQTQKVIVEVSAHLPRFKFEILPTRNVQGRLIGDSKYVVDKEGNYVRVTPDCMAAMELNYKALFEPLKRFELGEQNDCYEVPNPNENFQEILSQIAGKCDVALAVSVYGSLEALDKAFYQKGSNTKGTVAQKPSEESILKKLPYWDIEHSKAKQIKELRLGEPFSQIFKESFEGAQQLLLSQPEPFPVPKNTDELFTPARKGSTRVKAKESERLYVQELYDFYRDRYGSAQHTLEECHEMAARPPKECRISWDPSTDEAQKEFNARRRNFYYFTDLLKESNKAFKEFGELHNLPYHPSNSGPQGIFEKTGHKRTDTHQQLQFKAENVRANKFTETETHWNVSSWTLTGDAARLVKGDDLAKIKRAAGGTNRLYRGIATTWADGSIERGKKNGCVSCSDPTCQNPIDYESYRQLDKNGRLIPDNEPYKWRDSVDAYWNYIEENESSSDNGEDDDGDDNEAKYANPDKSSYSNHWQDPLPSVESETGIRKQLRLSRTALTSRQKKIWKLSNDERLTAKEIATRLGISRQAIEKAIAVCKKEMTDHIHDLA